MPDYQVSGEKNGGNWVRLQVGEINYKGLIKLKNQLNHINSDMVIFVKQIIYTFGEIRIYKKKGGVRLANKGCNYCCSLV